MVQLSILSGKLAGDIQIIQDGRVFVPLRGVFEQLGASVVYSNGTIDANGNGRDISLQIGSTQATVNGQPQKSTRLRNGDIISIGSAKIQFWLAPAPLRGLGLREALVWLLVASVVASQLALIYWLGS